MAVTAIRIHHLAIVFCCTFAASASAARLSYVVVQTEATPLHVNNAIYGTPVSQVLIGGNAKDVAIKGNGKLVYVVLATVDKSGSPIESEIDVVDATANKKLATIRSDAKNIPYLGVQSLNIDVSSDGSSLFVDSDSGVHKLFLSSDGRSVRSATTISPSYKKTSLELTRTGKYLVAIGANVTDYKTSGLSLIDPDTFTVIDEVSISSSAQGFATNENDSLIYVADLANDKILTFKIENGLLALTTTFDLTAQTYTACGPADVTFDGIFNRLYVTCSGFKGDPRSSDFGEISGNQGGIISIDLRTLKQSFFELKNDNETYAPNAGPIHPWSITFDSASRKIYLIKNKWGQPSGTFVSTLDVVPNGIVIDSEFEYLVMDKNNSYINGNFIGPECSECPDGLTNGSGGQTIRRGSAIEWFILVFGFGLIYLRKQRSEISHT